MPNLFWLSAKISVIQNNVIKFISKFLVSPVKKYRRRDKRGKRVKDFQRQWLIVEIYLANELFCTFKLIHRATLRTLKLPNQVIYQSWKVHVRVRENISVRFSKCDGIEDFKRIIDFMENSFIVSNFIEKVFSGNYIQLKKS